MKKILEYLREQLCLCPDAWFIVTLYVGSIIAGILLISWLKAL